MQLPSETADGFVLDHAGGIELGFNSDRLAGRRMDQDIDLAGAPLQDASPFGMDGHIVPERMPFHQGAGQRSVRLRLGISG